jgi:AraC-like DNA-binding protein
MSMLPSGASASWRQAVEHEIEALGWSRHARIERPDEDVTICTIDAAPPRDVTVYPEGPSTFSLSVFLEGRGTLSIDGAAPLTVRPGVGVLFTSSDRVRGENTILAGHRFRVVDMRFEAAFLLRAGGAALAGLGADLLTPHSAPDRRAVLAGFQAPPALLQAARDIADCRLADGLSRRLYLCSKAIEALSVAVSALQNAPAKSVVLRPEERLRLEKARQLIEKRFDADWTIVRLSREVGLNERKLKDGFRELVGNSVHAYLKQVRLDMAASLLQEGSSVTEAAMAVGFDSLSHFSKAFAAAKGVSPSRYARQSGDETPAKS